MIEINNGNNKINILVADMVEVDRYNDNLDIIVHLKSGDHYTATLFTPINILYLMRKDKLTGDSDHGHFFWSPDMVIIEELTEESIKRLVKYMLDTNTLHHAFIKGDPTEE